MASLMENLIQTLNEQYNAYESLVKLSEKKTPIIVSGSLDELQKITDEEQDVVALINAIDKKRTEIMMDIANVINKDATTLRLSDLVVMIQGRPEEAKALQDAKEKLVQIGKRLKSLNERNKMLLDNALEMVNFDLSLVQSAKQAPQMGNYNRGAMTTGEVYGTNLKGFDAKQ